MQDIKDTFRLFMTIGFKLLKSESKSNLPMKEKLRKLSNQISLRLWASLMHMKEGTQWTEKKTIENKIN